MPAEVVDLEIQGMTCASCAARIERRLGRMPGVEATVNYATEVAHVTLPAGTSAADAIATVEATGYGASLPEPDRERSDSPLVWRLFVAAVLGTPVVAMGMVPALQVEGWQWLSLVLATPIAVYSAWPFHRAAALALRHGATTMDTLVSLGVTAAYLWSVWALVWGGAGEMGMHMEGLLSTGEHAGLYLEVVAAVTAFLLAGRLIEHRARRGSVDALRSVARLGAREATRLTDAGEERVPVDALVVGDRIRVVPGEKIAADGVVVEGASTVDASLVTGESMPVEVTSGSAVIGATINGSGVLVVRATAVGGDTELARIARLLEQAQEGKTAVQRIADRISSVFVPVVVALSVLTLVGWIVATGDVQRAFTAAIATLIIACPCALGLATPTALLAGTTTGAELGILIRDARVLEAARRVRVLLADKTGTITAGRMRLEATTVADGEDAERVLRVAAALERGSEHPIAKAIVAAAPDAPAAASVQAAAGFGIHGVVDDVAAQAGSAAWIADAWAAPLPASLAAALDEAEARGATTVVVAWDGAARGVLAVRDEVRPTSAAAVARLARMGVRVGMVSGDNPRAAHAVAREVGIDDVTAAATPADKVEAVRAAQAGGSVAMVGDGVNDAAALAAADLGIAMGTGTDAAQHAADVTLVHGDLEAAADAIALSRRTLATIRLNLVWAFAYNTIAIPVAMAGLLTPMLAGLAMALSSVLVVASSLTLRLYRPRR
ncbi:heavy metal translocating P-type ATPase [Agrococcus jejuensis]|uniref:Cation-transporting P-type ATPase B n=1 Tax=Agrococcus jejuensis TaxID=399736 RepID=A0A1G8AXX7_9MICO|nr:heavy metal translocating P-type ATPase [Agrococcus jejuensis]SDH25862.1 Cu+-exporting ATPase [Agrococcus jejuensis]